MAQTKRKRRSKHRGNAAGVVETRGRTGRKPTEAERKKAGKAGVSREDRMFREPTWRGATYRSGFAALVFLALGLLVLKQHVAQALVLTVVVFALYIPLGYLTDSVLYKRKQRQKAAQKTTSKS